MVERFSGSALMQRRDDGLFVRHSDYAALKAQIAAVTEVVEALQLAAQSAGFQYMTAETRAKIEAAIAKATGSQA